MKIESYGKVFDHHLARLKRQLGHDHSDFMKLLGVLYVLRNLASRDDIQERTEQISFVKRMLWDLNLVDPDNRRPVDYEKRNGFLREIKERAALDILTLSNALLAAKEDGRVKLFLIHQALAARRANLEIFQRVRRHCG